MQGFNMKVFCFILPCALLFGLPLSSHSASTDNLDSIIDAAKKEGSVTLGLTLKDKSHGKPAGELYIAAFQKRYPFLKVNFKRIGGSRERERVILEMTSGIFDYDVASATAETQLPTIMDAKLPRIVDWQKLGVPKFLIHPQNIGISHRTLVFGIAYNRNLIPDNIANTFTWETCTDAKWNGKIVIEDQPRHLVSFYRDDVWGRTKTLDYAKRLAANKPVISQSQSDATEKVNAGSHYMMCGISRIQVKDIQTYTGSKSLGIVFPEPVPVNNSDLIYVPDKAKHPNAGILYSVWSSTPEAQKILDGIDFSGDPRIEGSTSKMEIKGKKVIYTTWEDMAQANDRVAELLQSMGMPVVR